MSRRISILFVVVVTLTCAGTTCLYSGAGPMDPLTAAAGGGWSPWLAAIADLLTVPIPTLGIADVRDVVLIFAVGAMFLVFGAAHLTGRTAPGAERASPDAPPNSKTTAPPEAGKECGARFKISAATSWLLGCGIGVFFLSMISEFVVANSDFSIGWCLRFVIGLVWAMLIARVFSPYMARAAVISLLTIGAAAILLAFARARDVGYAYIAWPIGPITVTAALAGCWAAIAVIWATGRFITRRNIGNAIFASAALLTFISALINTGRRSSAVGLVAAVLIIATITLIQHNPTKRRIAGGILTGILLIAASITYVAREAANPDRIRSGPVQLRLTYLEKSWELIREHPYLGIGPDMFIVEMTKRIAPLRAASPHIYHGGYDPTAHNEWLQAAVELGIPAAILYLALPLGVIALALRRAGTTEDKLLVYPIAAGLLAICITETASVTLRDPIMPAWYWTLIGLLCASKPHGASASLSGMRAPHSEPTHDSRATRNLIRSISFIWFGLFCLWLGAGALTFATRPTGAPNPESHLLEIALTSEKELEARYRNAALVTEVSGRAVSSGRPWASVAEIWKRLWQVFPGYSDVTQQYAQALMKGGEPKMALQVLESMLSVDQRPFDPEANALYASLRNDPAIYSECLRRALRSGALDEHTQSVFVDHLETINSPAIQEELDRARVVAAGGGDDNELAGTLVELLRISAFTRGQSGDWAGAITDQRLAAHCYRRLERESHPYRRAHAAETDAWYQLAAMIAEHQPENWHEAYDAIREAERYAVLGINHEDLADKHPEWGYVGGEVVPTEYPENLRPLWRLSALLHVVAGEDRFLDLRIFASLPPERWTQADLNAQLAALADEAYAMLSRVPAESRPKHFDKLPAMAEYYRKQTMSATGAPAAAQP